MSIVLCGPPCSGKSTIGPLLAKHLGRPFVDTDTLIETLNEKEVGCYQTCREIYLERGEAHFRDIEKQALRPIDPDDPTVIALGGGVLDGSHLGTVVYLRTSFEILWDRVQKNPKLPSYLDPENPKQGFSEHIAQRIEAYEAMADFFVDTDTLSPEDIVSKIEELMNDGSQ